jgi:RNA polymerase sigma-70 factor (ECF subfamily)
MTVEAGGMAQNLEQLGAQFLAERHVLMAFISGLVRDPNVVEDTLQEVWLRLSQASRDGMEIENLGRWCRGTARNLILHYWRQKRAAVIVPDSSMLDLVERAFDEQEDAKSVWTSRKYALMECLKTLPEKSRGVLAQVYERGMPLGDIARQTGQSYGAVLMLLSRIRKGLRECVQRRMQSESRTV